MNAAQLIEVLRAVALDGAGDVVSPENPGSKLDQVTRLRDDLRETAGRLGRQLDALRPEPFSAVVQEQPDDIAHAITELAANRRRYGRELLDAADWFDDERIDQLGDGYLRSAALWDGLAAALDVVSLDKVLELERTCVQWMTAAAERPTRYAF